jgi:hypothetical protein
MDQQLAPLMVRKSPSRTRCPPCLVPDHVPENEQVAMRTRGAVLCTTAALLGIRFGSDPEVPTVLWLSPTARLRYLGKRGSCWDDAARS